MCALALSLRGLAPNSAKRVPPVRRQDLIPKAWTGAEDLVFNLLLRVLSAPLPKLKAPGCFKAKSTCDARDGRVCWQAADSDKGSIIAWVRPHSPPPPPDGIRTMS